MVHGEWRIEDGHGGGWGKTAHEWFTMTNGVEMGNGTRKTRIDADGRRKDFKHKGHKGNEGKVREEVRWET
jgi:hypothetical protein